MQYGLDVLCLAKFGNVAAKYWPEGVACGCFSQKDLAGDVLPALSLVLKTKKCPRVRVQLCYKASHSYASSFSEIANEAARVWAFAKRFPLVAFEFSGATEHKLSRALAQSLCDIVLEAAPGVVYVNNPMKGGALLPNSDRVLNETHGFTPQGASFNFSFDGTNAFDADVESIRNKLSHASTFYFWGPRFNLKWGMKLPDDPHCPANDKEAPINRNALPNGHWFKSMTALMSPKGDTKLPKSFIYKPMAENNGPSNGVPDSKGDRPVLICPHKVDSISLRTIKGQLVARLPYYGTYDAIPGTHRYYSTQRGYQLSDKAEKLSGSRLMDIVIAGKVMGRINGAFRDGSYRS